jgi:hypothetical protein
MHPQMHAYTYAALGDGGSEEQKLLATKTLNLETN